MQTREPVKFRPYRDFSILPGWTHMPASAQLDRELVISACDPDARRNRLPRKTHHAIGFANFAAVAFGGSRALENRPPPGAVRWQPSFPAGVIRGSLKRIVDRQN